MPPTPTPAMPLPPVPVALPAAELLKRLDTASRRGRLPGYLAGRGTELFAAEELGTPFDYRLSARLVEEPNGGTLVFSLRRLPRMPLIFVLVLVFSVWPGVWLTDSMIRAYFTSYHFQTWIWYLPITVLPIPWMWRGWSRRSEESASALAAEFIEKVRAEVGAEVVE